MLIAAGLCTAVVAACSDSIEPAQPKPGTGGSSGNNTGGSGDNGTAGSGNSTNGGMSGGGGGDIIADGPCTAECCPTDGACYSDMTKAAMSPGASCLATRDNTNQKHVSMRQTWINATAPKGNVGGAVYAVLSGRTELPLKTPMMGMSTGLPDCKMNGGIVGYGGYMQLTDIYFANGMNGTMRDYDKDFATTGFSTYVTTMNVLEDLKSGFCMGTQDWVPDSKPTDYTKYELADADMSPQTDFGGKPWPKGLTAPLALKTAP